LGFAVGKQSGPAVVKFRVRGLAGGSGKIEWLPSGIADAADGAKSVRFELTGGDWQEIGVELATKGPLGIVRVYLPAQDRAVELDWIELKGSGASRRWDF
jgi:hypothetical protein